MMKPPALIAFCTLALAACGGKKDSASPDASTDASTGSSTGSDVTLASAGPDGSRSGSWTADGATVQFTVTAVVDGVAEARFEAADGSESVVARVTAFDRGEILIGATARDGNGALTAAEDAVVKSLQGGGLAEALALIPLEIGCRDATIAPEQLASLLMPWQLILKYAAPDRLDRVAEIAGRATCNYFPDPSLVDASTDTPVQGSQLRLSNENPIPTVFGILPFDDVGSVELREAKSAGDILGPCKALCRGACGGDCEPRNCNASTVWRCETDENGANTGNKKKWTMQHCGTHDGCRVHDDCYDTCHQAEKCGTWSAAVCRRGCDQEACYNYPTECARWANGLGTFDGYLDFYYDDLSQAVDDKTLCPLVPPLDARFQDPPSENKMNFTEANSYCGTLTLDGFSWRLPALSEMQELIEGCANWDCSRVDWCEGCAAGGGPGQGSCYWSPAAHGACDAYWTSSPFTYQAGLYWAVLFTTASGAAAHGDVPDLKYYVRCIKNQ